MKAPRRSTSSTDQRADARSAVMLGWLSGLGLLVAPWIGAGVLASLGSLTGRES